MGLRSRFCTHRFTPWISGAFGLQGPKAEARMTDSEIVEMNRVFEKTEHH